MTCGPRAGVAARSRHGHLGRSPRRPENGVACVEGGHVAQNAQEGQIPSVIRNRLLDTSGYQCVSLHVVPFDIINENLIGVIRLDFL